LAITKSATALKTASTPAPLPDTDEALAPVKIALLLPAAYSLRDLRRAGELAAGLADARTQRGEALEVAVGLAERDEERWRRGERTIRSRAPAAVVRHLEWTSVPVDNARRMFHQLDPALDLEGLSEVIVPRDWGWNFQDCALWISLADPATGPVLPLRRIVYYSLGLPERYVPQMVAASIHDPYWARQAEAFRMWRQAEVVTSDPTTIADLVSYAGVRSERTEIIPDVLESMAPLAQADEQDRNRQVLVWTLRGSSVDDLEACLAGLQIYRREGGLLDVVIAEEARADAAAHPSLAALPADLLRLYGELRHVTYRSLDELDRLLVRSGGLWSSQIAGGAGEHLLEAERAGLHVLAPSFPLNRQLAERRGLSARLYAPGEALGIADALKEVEQLASTPVPLPAPQDEVPSSEKFGFLLDRLLANARAS